MSEQPQTRADWAALAARLTPETGLLIDGRCRAALDGRTQLVINPANGEIVAEAACGGAADIELAVASARAAWQDGRWRHMLPRTRDRKSVV